jgi:hypothetical protein
VFGKEAHMMSNSTIEGFMWGMCAGIVLAYVFRTPDEPDALSDNHLIDGHGSENCTSAHRDEMHAASG